jgi:predicted deacylase
MIPIDAGAAGPLPRLDVAPPRAVDRLDLGVLAPGEVHALWLTLMEDGLGCPVRIPLLVGRGRKPGPTVGITAAVHGNELNGIPVIHSLFHHLAGAKVAGTVVAALAVNVPGVHRRERAFLDQGDLNHRFPGAPEGPTAVQYAHRLLDEIVEHVDVLIDLHTASAGRVNSLYIRADMRDPDIAAMTYRMRPEIIVHNPPTDGTLRGSAQDMGIPALTVEIGNPQRFQRNYIRRTRLGLQTVLAHLGVIKRKPPALGEAPVLCASSQWIYTTGGGLLTVPPELTAPVAAGAAIAHLRDVFGTDLRTLHAPEAGVVVGKAVDPIAQTGARVLHLGRVATAADGLLTREET